MFLWVSLPSRGQIKEHIPITSIRRPYLYCNRCDRLQWRVCSLASEPQLTCVQIVAPSIYIAASDVISCALMEALVTVCVVSIWSSVVSALYPSLHMGYKYGISWQSVVVVMANQWLSRANKWCHHKNLFQKRPLDRIKTPRTALFLRCRRIYKVGQFNFQGFTALFKWRSSGLWRDVRWDCSARRRNVLPPSADWLSFVQSMLRVLENATVLQLVKTFPAF